MADAPPPAAPPAGAPAGAPAAGGDDYVDKGVAAVQKKYGMDPVKNKGTTEKITDAARGFIEKITGKKIPAKVSN